VDAEMLQRDTDVIDIRELYKLLDGLGVPWGRVRGKIYGFHFGRVRNIGGHARWSKQAFMDRLKEMDLIPAKTTQPELPEFPPQPLPGASLVAGSKAMAKAMPTTKDTANAMATAIDKLTAELRCTNMILSRLAPSQSATQEIL